MKPFVLALSLAILCACSKPTGSTTTSAPPTVCTKEGAQCTYAEGKIGLCNATSATTTCDGAPCLTCMSLH